MFFIKQVANDLGITPQAIYKQKEDLIDKGYMLKTTTNDWEITAEGYNYLKERQINRVKRKQVELKEDESINIKNTENNVVYSLNETLKNFYETRIEEMKQSYENQLNEQKKQVEYFKNLYEDGLAKLVEMPVNWCEELGTVLANDEVIDGKSERGGYPVVRKNMKQWVIDIPKYAEKLLNGLDEIDWPNSYKFLKIH